MSEAVSNNNFKKSKEDAIKKQNGELPPDLDQDGKMINPHNPEFITKVPWYLGSSGPTLKHHNVQKEKHELTMNETDAIIRAKLRAKEDYSNTMNSIMRATTGYKKGACKNCGATTHVAKDCVERPRSKAKSAEKTGISSSTGLDIKLDLEAHGKVTYAAKRDQWSGYDPSEHQETIARHERLENERKKKLKEEKQLQMQQELMKKMNESDSTETNPEGEIVSEVSGNRSGKKNKVMFTKKSNTTEDISNSDSDVDSDADSDSDSDSDSDVDDAKLNKKEFKAKDEQAVDFQGRQARQGGVGGAQMMTTVRNLRIREDTPKYLRNLNLDSAHYDAKSRSMRSNPNAHTGENPEDLVYAGDNFAKLSGDALILAQTQVMCWDMQAGAGKKGNDDSSAGVVDLLSNPSQAELLVKKYKAEKEVLKDQNKKELLARYGSVASGNNKNDKIIESLTDARLRLGQTEVFNEYSIDGRVVKGPAAGFVPKKHIKYEEDVYTNNHTSVWGSYYHRGLRKWGYACCHALSYNAYCTGEVGKEANDSANGGGATVDLNVAKKLVEFQQKRDDNGASNATSSSAGTHPNSSKYVKAGTTNDGQGIALDQEKLKEAMQREENRLKQCKDDSHMNNKRGYNSTDANVETTEEDLEAFRLKRLKAEDPMANLDFDSETLLDYN